MKRIPILATLLVALAVTAMVALGVWQLGRADEKDALIDRFRANRALPAMAFPVGAPVPAEAMFRRSAVDCRAVDDWTVRGGRAVDGTTGYRHIATCRTGAGATPAAIDMGVSRAPDVQPGWAGGAVAGIVTVLPDSTSLIGRLFGRAPPAQAMLVADTPAPGLARSAPPSPETVPNNHLAYAGQWFFFAIVALLIFVLALRRRRVAD